MEIGNEGNLCYCNDPRKLMDRLMATENQEDFKNGLIGLSSIVDIDEGNYILLAKRVDLLEYQIMKLDLAIGKLFEGINELKKKVGMV